MFKEQSGHSEGTVVGGEVVEVMWPNSYPK